MKGIEGPPSLRIGRLQPPDGFLMIDTFHGQRPTGHQNRNENEADNHPDPTHTNEPASPDKRNPPSTAPQKRDSPNREKPTMGLLIEILPEIGIFPPPLTA